jgi:sigma-B regulation protein RsbU (phosphoserine phosphatase)
MPTGGSTIKNQFSALQVGSITEILDTLSVKSPIAWAIDMLANNPDANALPIERDGVIIGILDRQIIEELNESTWNKFWRRDLDTYAKAEVDWFQAFDYIETVLPRALKANDEKGINHFVVYYRQSYMGIVSLNRLINQASILRMQDMMRAKEVQQGLLNRSHIKDPRISKGLFIRMAHEVGGDFYQDIAFDEDHILLACFDVSGKNLAASLMTTGIGAFFSAVKYFGTPEDFRSTDLTPRMNAYLRDLIPGDSFIAAVLIYVDFVHGTVKIQNMGYSPVYAFIPGESKVACKVIKPNMRPLGIDMDEMEKQTEYTLQIVKDMKIIAFSDGLTDLENMDQIKYGDERAQEFVLAHYSSPIETLQKEIESEVDNWMANTAQKDDITVFAVRFTGVVKKA